MKNLAFFILFLFITFNLFSEQVSLDTAQIVAQNWYSFIYEEVNTTISNYSIETNKGLQTSFIFNFQEGGFVITSASNDAEPILAYNDTGEIISLRSPGFECMLEGYNKQIYDIINESIINENNRTKWQELLDNTFSQDETSIVLHMPSTWNQGNPYNIFVPSFNGTRCPVGCVATAMAQIINYHKYCADFDFDNDILKSNYAYGMFPAIMIDEDHNEYDFITFNQLDTYMTNVLSIFNSSQYLTEVDDRAALSFACGIACRSNYQIGGTGSYAYKAQYGFHSFFGYFADSVVRSTYSEDEWFTLLENELSEGRPIYYQGIDADPNNPVGHAFIIHGCRITSSDPPYSFLINWGWGGNEDGYFTLTTLNPYNYHFILDQESLVNIKPSALTLAGQVFDANPAYEFYQFAHSFNIFYSDLQNPLGVLIEIKHYNQNARYVLQFEEYPNQNDQYEFIYTSENMPDDKYEYAEQIYQINGDQNFMFIPDIELFWKFKPFYSGWNWESFPVLDRTGNNPVPAIPVLEEMEDFPEDITNINVLNGPIGYEQGYGPLTYEYGAWAPPNGYQLQSTRCYKIEVLPELSYFLNYRELYIEGTSLYPTTTIDLIAGQDNWIGYWIKASQDIDDAFGQHWEKIKSIKAEDWEWKNMTPERGGGPVPIYYPIRPLRYNKGYVVRVKEDIIGFQWDVSGEQESRYTHQTPEFFTYEEKPDYETIIVDSISGGGNVIEIGVFENDICVGASVVDSLPLQILAYTDAMNRGDNFDFQVSYSGGRGYQSVKSYSILNLETGKFEHKKPLIIGEQEHNIIQLYLEEGEEDTPISNNFTLNSNYPNPFNPSTIISFSIPEDTKVNLKVYNIKGQVVKTLLKEQIESGEHRITWDGKDNNNKQVASGIYFYKISAGKETKVKKMLLLK